MSQDFRSGHGLLSSVKADTGPFLQARSVVPIRGKVAHAVAIHLSCKPTPTQAQHRHVRLRHPPSRSTPPRLRSATSSTRMWLGLPPLQRSDHLLYCRPGSTDRRSESLCASCRLHQLSRTGGERDRSRRDRRARDRCNRQSCFCVKLEIESSRLQVMGTITRVTPQQAHLVLSTVNSRPLPESTEDFTGIVRISDIRLTERDKLKMGECFRLGDIVKAKVVSLPLLSDASELRCSAIAGRCAELLLVDGRKRAWCSARPVRTG